MLLQVRNSVIGRDCHIGKGVHIHGCYIHNGVTICDGAQLQSAVVCDGAVIMSEAVLCSRCIVSYQVRLFSPLALGTVPVSQAWFAATLSVLVSSISGVVAL